MRDKNQLIPGCSSSLIKSYQLLRFSNVSDDILENYDPSDPWVLVAMLAITFKTFTSYPLLAFCGRAGDDLEIFSTVSFTWLIVGILNDIHVVYRLSYAGIDSLWIELRGFTGLEQERGEFTRRFLQATVWFVSSLVFALLIPGILFVDIMS